MNLSTKKHMEVSVVQNTYAEIKSACMDNKNDSTIIQATKKLIKHCMLIRSYHFHYFILEIGMITPKTKV